MNVARFNGSLRAARITAHRHRSALEAAYADFIRHASTLAAKRLRSHAMTAATGDGTPDWQLPPEGVLVDYAALVPPQILARLHRQIVQDVAGRTLGAAGIAWDITHPLSQALLDAASQRTGLRLGEAVQPILRETVLGAYQRGLSVLDAAALIEENLGDATVWQARMLARTDLNSLSNGGSVMAAQMVGVEYKQWLSAEDESVRPTHAEADGQVVPVDAPFSVGGEELEYPGDPAGSDEETCNCRCTVIYLDPDEAVAASGALRNGVHSQAVAASAEAVARIPARGFRGATRPALAAAVSEGVRWQADLAFEGLATRDRRYIMPGATFWGDLPFTLMAMTKTGPGGHEGAFVAGKITEIIRDGENDVEGNPLPEGVTAIRGIGAFDVNDDGVETARLVGEKILRGVSLDPGEIEKSYRDPDSGDLYRESDLLELDPARLEVMQTAFTKFEIAGATVCSVPAFADAQVAIAASALDERLASALGALTHVTEMAARLGEAQARTQDLEQAIRAAADERHRDSLAQKTETLTLIESLTARIAAGEQISEAMLASLAKLTDRQPRTISVVRDENGRAAAYEVA